MTNTTTCFVCGKKASVNDLLYICQGKYRHRSRCKPGSKRWMESDKGKTSHVREYFEKQENAH